MSAPERVDVLLDRWWTPGQLAARWNVDPKTARARLRELNRRAEGRLFDPAAKSIRVLGRALDRECPGALGGAVGDRVGARDVRQVAADVRDLEAWREQVDAWRDAATQELMALRQA